MKLLSHIISWLFLPLLMPVYVMATVMYIPSMEADFFQENTLYWINPNFKWVVLSWFAIFSFLAPGLSLLIMKVSKNISSIEVDNQSERGMPITITAMFCFILGMLFLLKAPEGILPPMVYGMPWGGFLAIVIAGYINRKDKISLHALGAGMMYGFFVLYYFFQAEFYFEIIIIATLVSGLVLSARVHLGKHTLKQVINGFMLGFFCMIVVEIAFIIFKS